MIPYGKQSINEADIEAVVEVLNSDFLTQGPVVPLFEETVSQYSNASYGVATNSATSALHIACLALNVGEGDWVWTTPITFVASANCALYCGAKVDFVDIDPLTFNMSIDSLRNKLEMAEKNGLLPKVVIPVHLCGQSCEMSDIQELSKRFGFKVIEDASHAIGGKYKGLPVGNCKYSDVTIFSFHPVKIITTGEGGMALTNDFQIAEKMQLHRGHGITSTESKMDERPPHEMWNYQQIDLGYNYRMTDIQAALGLSQLKRLDEFVESRQKIAKMYDQAFESTSLKVQSQHRDSYSAYHLYIIRVSSDKSKIQQKEFYSQLRECGVAVNLHYIPVYLQPYYEKLGFKRGYCPEAEKYFKEVISIPMFPTLQQEDFNQVVESIRSILKE